MFDLKWGDTHGWSPCENMVMVPSTIRKEDITSVLNITWEEHCVECAIPECYHNCILYRERKDGACARFKHGIISDERFKGHDGFGADITFRKWGKLEACLTESCRDALDFDEFVVECYSPHTATFTMICEYFTENNRIRNTRFRHSFQVEYGFNSFHIPFGDMNIGAPEGYIYLYPDSSVEEKRLIFTWLDFIKYKDQKKIKCVAWDLDNTLWNGTLIEQGEVTINAEVIDLIKDLDKKGILQTIVSKNDFDPCWDELKKKGIHEYFLSPAINWGRKSENLQEIARNLNIDLDTFAVIDDSSFEREEISGSLPQVRVYTEKDIDHLLGYEEFDVIVSEESSTRREKYMKEAQRINEKREFSGSYEDFIINCKMVTEVFVPREDADIERCYELIQRSNQLNLSTIRYSRTGFGELLQEPGVLSTAIRCRDKFGSYGIVGFASIHFKQGIPCMENFVLSCRAAQKRVEHSYLKAMLAVLAKNGYDYLHVQLIHTDKNGPLCRVFSELPFHPISVQEKVNILSIGSGVLADIKDVMNVTVDETVVTFYAKA